MRAAGSMLYLDDVSVSFDGFRAINALSIALAPGEMRAVIGPNGAGKTTMMDIVTGKTRPDTGDVIFDQTVDLTRHDEARIAQLGIGRKFQRPTVFETHTVFDNLLLSVAGGRGVRATLFARGPRRPSGSGSTISSRPSTFRPGATKWRRTSATARSSGWRSACCWRRTRSCCSSTSRPPA